MSGPSRRIRLTLPVSVTTEKLLTVMRRQDNKLYLRGEVFWNSNVYAHGDLLSVLSAYGFGGAADASNGYGHAVSTFQLVGMAEGSGEPILLYSDGNAEGYSFAKGETPWSVKMELPQSLFSTASSEPAEAINSSGQFTATMQGVAMPSKELVFGYGQTLGEFEGYLLSDGPADAKDVFGSVRGYLVGSLNPGSDAGLAIVLTGIGDSASTAIPVAQTTESILMIGEPHLETNTAAEAVDSYTVTFVANGRVVHEDLVLEGESWVDPVANELINAPTKQPTISHTFEFSGWSKTEGGPVESSGQTVLLEERAMTGFASNSEFGGVYTRFAAFGTDMDAFTLVLGKTYKVLWDGVWYEVVAQDASSFSPGALLLGNGAMIGLSNTGEPFGIGWLDGYAVMLAAVDGSASESHTVGVYQGVTEDLVLYAAFNESIRHYDISFYDDDTLLTTISFAYGETPSYTATKEGFISIGWTPELVPVAGEASYRAQWKQISAFADATWDEIAMVAESGKADAVFAVGDQKTIPITWYDGSVSDVVFEIIGINHDDLADGSGKAGLTLGSKTALYDYDVCKGTNKSMQSTGWSASTLRSALNDAAEYVLGDEIYSHVKAVLKVSAAKWVSGQNENLEETVDTLFIPSATEYFGDNSYTTYVIKGQGTQYPRFVSTANRQKYGQVRPNNTSTSVGFIEHHTRSRSSNHNIQVTNVLSSGAAKHGVVQYMCICFCI